MDRPAELRSALLALAPRVAPVSLAVERSLPVDEAFAGILPSGLTRGQRVAMAGPGATSLALALAAGPTRQSSWVGVVGGSSLGLAAAEELGVRLERMVVVDAPPAGRWGATVAALVEGFEVVIVAPGHPVSARDDRRLSARVREEGAVVLQLGRNWAGADVELTVAASSWHGLGEGHGHLRARRVCVNVAGRRAGARPRRAELWLPDPQGRLRPVGPSHPSGSGEGSGPPVLSSVG